MTRAFTNVKALENKPVKGYESDTWEYRDTPEGGINSPILMNLDESIKASQGGVVTNAVPTNQAIDTDIVDIDNFRKTWISQKGFNPWNWQTEFEQKFQSSIQSVWNKTFQGKIRYGSSLTTDQAKLLKQNMSTYYTALENQYKSKSEDAKDEYDIIVEQVNKRNTRIETEQKEARKQREKVVNTITKIEGDKKITQKLNQAGEIVAQEESPAASKNQNYKDKMSLVAKSINISPEDLAKGNINQQQATDLLKAYKKQFGSDDLISMLLTGNLGGTETTPAPSTLLYDAEGNPIRTEE